MLDTQNRAEDIYRKSTELKAAGKTETEIAKDLGLLSASELRRIRAEYMQKDRA